MRLKRLTAAALAVAALAGAAACGDTTAALPSSPDAITGALGTYTLQSINASPLPVVTRRDGNGSASMVTAGQLTLGAGTFYQSLTIADSTAAGQSSTHTSGTQGTFTMTGDQIHFRAADGGTWDGTYRVTKIEYSITGNSGPVAFLFVRD
jgi:hypothetical protein